MPKLNKLQKSVRTYKKMVLNMKLDPRHKSYREALTYLRNLYSEFGRKTVREEIDAN